MRVEPFRLLMPVCLRGAGFQYRNLYNGSELSHIRHKSYQRFQKRPSASAWLGRWAARTTFYGEVGILAGCCGGVFLYNLEEVPVSGRRRFNIVSPQLEESMGKDMYRQIMREYGDRVLPDSDPRARLVRKVLNRLIPSSGLDEKVWEVHVIESDQINAFVVPGGKVFVFTGLLPICKDEEGIAAVIGHEIAHNVAHHAAEKMSRAGLLMLGMLAFHVLTGTMPDRLYHNISQILFEMPRSRQQESEADYIGLMMMAQSCYPPSASLEMFYRMRQAEKGRQAPPAFLSTHPSSDIRQAQLQQWLPKANALLSSSNCGQLPEKMMDFRRTLHDRLP